jgi:erythromycin esterase
MKKLERRAYLLGLLTLVLLSFTALQLRPVSASQAPFLNLDFELAVRHLPLTWSVGGSGFDFRLDAVDFHSGQQSLRIRHGMASANTLATASHSFPIELVRGKRVRVRGWLKTMNVTGAAGIWWRVDGEHETISLDNAPPPGLPLGNSNWTRYEFEREISRDGKTIYWGVFLRGGGTAWFDNLEIFIDGAPLQQGSPATLTFS